MGFPSGKSGVKGKLPVAKGAVAVFGVAMDVLDTIGIPGVAVAAKTAMKIIGAIEKSENNRKECLLVSSYVEQIARTMASLAVQGQDQVISEHFRQQVESLTVLLSETLVVVEEMGRRSRLQRMLSHVEDREKFTLLETKLSNALQLFQVQAQFETLRRLSPFVPSPTGNPTVHMVAPPRPNHVFGREQVLARLSLEVDQDIPTRQIVIGAAGIGKTTVGLETYYCPASIARFGAARHFLSCESLTTPSLLISALCAALHAPATSQQPLQSLVNHLQVMPKSLLLLDNFETSWDPACSRHEIEDILGHLASSPTLSIIVTMRGNTYPHNVGWAPGSTEPLPLLDKCAAAKIYQQICPAAKIGPEFEVLMDEVGRLPLNVKLLASAARSSALDNNPAQLRARWKQEKTDLLDDGVHSVQATIMVSITCDTMLRNPEALQLLSLIAPLPSGLSNRTLLQLSPRFERPAKAAELLCKVALAYWEDERLKVLPPIRHLVQSQFEADDAHQDHLHAIYLGIVRNLPLPFDISEHPRPNTDLTALRAVYDAIHPEAQNIRTILEYRLAKGCTDDLAIATLAYSEYQSVIGDSSRALLQAVAENASTIAPELYAWTLWLEAEESLDRQATDDARTALLACHAWFTSCTSSPPPMAGLILCDLLFGSYHAAQGELAESTGAYQRASAPLSGPNEFFRQAYASLVLHDIKVLQGQRSDATSELSNALHAFKARGDLRRAMRCAVILRDEYASEQNIVGAESAARVMEELVALVDRRRLSAIRSCASAVVHDAKGSYDQAIRAWDLARTEFDALGSRGDTADCEYAYGMLCAAHSRAEEAVSALKSARTRYESLQDVVSVAHCLWAMHKPYLQLREYHNVIDTLLQAKERYTVLERHADVADCMRDLHQAYHPLGRHNDSIETLCLAKGIYGRLDRQPDVAYCLWALHEPCQALELYAAAIDTIEEAKKIYIKLNQQMDEADCLRDLYHQYHGLGRYQEAVETLTASRELYEKLGAKLDAAYCLWALHKPYQSLGLHDQAIDSLHRAKAKYDALGKHMDSADCSRDLYAPYVALGQHVEAIGAIYAAKAIYERFDNREEMAFCSWALHEPYCARREFDRAIAVLQDASALYEALGNSADVADCLRDLHQPFHELDRHEEEVQTLESARKLYEEQDNWDSQAYCLWALSTPFQLLGKPEKAIEVLRRAKSMYEILEQPEDVANCMRKLAEPYHSLGRHKNAVDTLLMAIGSYEELSDRFNVAGCLWAMHQPYRSLGWYDDAIEKVREAKKIYAALGETELVDKCAQTLRDM